MTEYVYLDEILEREDPRVTNEDFDNNARASFEREDQALTAAADAVKKVWPAANQAAMLALNLAKVGHEAKRTDSKTVYTLKSLPASELANWELTGRYEVSVAIENITGLQGELDSKPTLDEGTGKIKTSDLPESVLGALQFKGTWNAASNNITSDDEEYNASGIPAASAGNKGHYLIVQTSGTTNIDGVSEWGAGDWIVSIGSKWEKLDATDLVTMVNGKVGAVVLNADDIEPTGTREWASPGEKNTWNNKVNTSDVVNDLGTGDVTKVLSAAQGPLIDGRLSDLEGAYGGLDAAYAALLVAVAGKQATITPSAGWGGPFTGENKIGFAITDFGEGGGKTIMDLAAVVAAIINELKTQNLFIP